MKRKSILEISIADKRWRKIPRLLPRLEEAARAALSHLPKSKQIPATATLLLTSDAAVRKLNHDFRGMDKPTNVLSFPQYEPSGLPKKGKHRGAAELGDIAIAYQYVVDEAKRDHKILINHIIHLMIHGLLHLLGYDHLSDAEAMRMERLEKKVMSVLGLPDPYRAEQPMELKRARTTKRKK